MNKDYMQMQNDVKEAIQSKFGEILKSQKNLTLQYSVSQITYN